MAQSTQEIGKQFVEALQNGDEKAAQKFWSEDVVSREPMDGPMAELKGRKSVEGKGQWWYDNHEVNEMKAMGPFVHGDQFAVEFYVDVTVKADGQRRKMHEVGLYTVKDGKIVEERFFV
jgi:ketosteroid isomerase-like protein